MTRTSIEVETSEVTRGERQFIAHQMRAGGATLELIGWVLGVTHERARQVLLQPAEPHVRRAVSDPYACPSCGRIVRQAWRKSEHRAGRCDPVR